MILKIVILIVLITLLYKALKSLITIFYTINLYRSQINMLETALNYFTDRFKLSEEEVKELNILVESNINDKKYTVKEIMIFYFRLIYEVNKDMRR